VILDSFFETVRRTVLPNGLTLITRRQPDTGVVAINTWVKAGYFHEPDEVAGMAHLFEHMFFKGSKNFPGAEDIARQVSSLGGASNAGTIYDSTNYYFVLPSEGLARGIEIQADAIANPLFDSEELKKEAEVVIEESNRKLDTPAAVAIENMFATAFTKHRIRRWRIGSNEVLRNIRRDDLLAFFETLYRPENIVLTICGDFEQQEVLDVVSRTFGAIPRGTLVKERGPEEPPQTEFRFAETTGDVQQSFSVIGWHVPGLGHPDNEALDVLSMVLGAGRYSRLYRSVVSSGAANTISADNTVYEDVGIFNVRISADDENLERAEALAITEIERLRRFGPTNYELELARNGAESSAIFELSDVLGQAQTLGWFEVRGGYEKLGAYLTRLESIAPDDVRRVAREYVVPENMTLYRFRRNGAPAGRREAILEGLRAAADEAATSTHEELTHPALPAAPAGATAETHARSFVLSNGIALFVREIPGTPTVSTGVYFKGGRVHENSSIAGITQLMARVMKRGTASRTMEQIDREIEYLGTQLGIMVEDDYLGFTLDILRSHYTAGLEILVDVMRNPSFPEDEIEKARRQQIASIRRVLDSTTARPFQLLRSMFYLNHPYGLPDGGFVSSIEPLTRDDLVAWHRSEIVADAATIVVVGDVASEDVVKLMEASFGSLPKSEGLRRPVPAVERVTTTTEIVELRDKKQSGIAIAYATVPPVHPDWITLRVIQDICSGLAGTLFAELRGRRSLAYTVHAGDASNMLAGAFVAYIATEASKEQEAKEALLAEIRRLAVDGFQKDDLDRAKSHLSGTTRIRLQTNAARRSEIAQTYLFNLGVDFTPRFLERVHAISLEECREVADQYLTVDSIVIATVRGRA
jgi:zinc protease